MTFEQKPEGSETMNHADMGGERTIASFESGSYFFLVLYILSDLFIEKVLVN